MKVGDNVAYSVRWLRSAFGGQAPTARLGRARGVITHITDLGQTKIATVSWNMEGVPNKVNVANLAEVGPNPKFCQC